MDKVSSQHAPGTVDASAGDKPRKKLVKALPSLPSLASASEMTDVSYQVKVDCSPVVWDSLEINSVFSLSPDGSYPLIKIHRSKYADLRTGKSFRAGSGRCYKVVF